jgi:hypothetical protein
MVAEDRTEKRLRSVENRLSRLESRLRNPKARSKETPRATLPKHIMNLREAGFFSQPRSADEVHKKLSATYHCLPNRVEVALFRLASARKLRKATKRINSHSYQAFVW